MRSNKIFYLLIVLILGFIVALSVGQSRKANQEVKRLKNNQNILNQELKQYILKDSTQVVEIDELSYSRDEYMSYCQQYFDELEDLKIKYKRVKELSQTSTKAVYLIDTLIARDTIIIKEKTIDTLKVIDYNNPYITLTANVLQDTIKDLRVTTFDTITAIVSKEYRKRFLFIKWSPYYKTTLHNKNPYSRITNAEKIKVK